MQLYINMAEYFPRSHDGVPLNNITVKHIVQRFEKI